MWTPGAFKVWYGVLKEPDLNYYGMQLVDILRKHGLDYLGAHGGAVGTLKKQMAITPITYVKQDRFQLISKHDTASTKERSPKLMLHDRWFDFNLSTVLKPYKFTEVIQGMGDSCELLAMLCDETLDKRIHNRIIYIELPDVGRFDFVNIHFLGIDHESQPLG